MPSQLASSNSASVVAAVSAAAQQAAAAAAAATTTTTTNSSLDLDDRSRDMCPICKTDKYLSPTMIFLINPECYHKVCESCVDRIFSMGPTKCPYPSCSKILRKNRFKKQIFEDLSIEKDNDIRRKVLDVYNKGENDFNGDLKAYNEYLEEIEVMIYNLTNDVNVEDTLNKLNEYELLNKDLIKENKDRVSKEYQDYITKQNMEKQFKLTKLKLEKEIRDEETKLEQLSKQEIINQLSSSQADSDNIISNAKKSLLRKTSMRRKQLKALQDQQYAQLQALSNGQQQDPSSSSAQGQESSQIPYTPFNGDSASKHPFKYQGQSDYYDPFYIDMVNKDAQYRAGGYELDHFYKRSLQEAFIGLDCFIQEEKI